MFTLSTSLLIGLASAFVTTQPVSFRTHLNAPRARNVVPKGVYRSDQEMMLHGSTNNDNNQTETLDSNATSERSIGSVVLQPRMQEEKLLSATQGGNHLKDMRPATLDAGNTSAAGIAKEKIQPGKPLDVAEESSPTVSSIHDNSDARDDSPIAMDAATARELDECVTWMVSAPSAREELLDSVENLTLPSVYNTTGAAFKSNQNRTRRRHRPQPLRMPEYFGRISRDMRHLAVSIASSSEDVHQWRTFCQEGNGGLMPLLECIREGARYIHLQKQQRSDPTISDFMDRHEESILGACSACRALRDLCAVSPELSAVITDGVLRANAAWSTATMRTSHRLEMFKELEREQDAATEHQAENNLMHDFMTILKYANGHSEQLNRKTTHIPFRQRRNRREARLRCKLYVTQLLLAMTVSSDDAVEAIRDTAGLPEAILRCSSYSRGEQTRRWLRYPAEIMNFFCFPKRKNSNKVAADEKDANAAEEGQKEKVFRPFVRAGAIHSNLDGHVRRTANQILAAIGYNRWVPKIPGQKGLRILVLDGGGSRGMVAVSLVKGVVDSMDGVEVSDSFDIIAGTSTGGIISFLVGLRREASNLAVDRYNQLIKQIFVKSALSTPMMLFTTATYDEASFMDILSDILGDNIMLDSRADPAVPYVFCVASKMSSTPTHVALFRNYNYAGGELADPFTIDPEEARIELDLPLELEHEIIGKSSYAQRKHGTPNAGYEIEGSRHPGSFRVLQRYALRASTAAPTVFKPVMMGGEMYCDGGIVASNPAAVAVHEARALFPHIPIELVVSVGTGGFVEQKSSPRIGWDGIIGQIVNSATDAEQIHHVLEDILGEGSESAIQRGPHISQTRYYRLNPTLGLPDEFPIDVTEPAKLDRLQQIATEYLAEPAQQKKLEEIGDILQGRRGWRKWLP